jgi:hypothetical protein
LVVDTELSSNVTKMGDNVYVSFTEDQWKYQSLASSPVKINPFGLVDNVGTLQLSPSADEWKESIEEAQRVIQGENKLAAKQSLLWNNWTWNWSGRSPNEIYNTNALNINGSQRQVLADIDRLSSSNSSVPTVTSTARHVNRVVSSETIRSVVNGRYVDLALIPWIRSRKVYFHAKGLTPNTKFTPFFDGVDVSAWCREETTFVKWSDREDDLGNKLRSSDITSHPDGTTDLIADENGEVIGSFFIPNIRPSYYVDRYNKKKLINTAYQRFRCGVREFKLLDIDRNDWAEAGSKCFAYYSATGQVDKAWAGFWSLRGWNHVVPWGYLNKNVPYNSNELKDALNQVPASGVGIVGPHISGRFGPTTSVLSGAALAGLDANGQMSQVLSDYVDVNTNIFGGTNVNVLSIPQNPLAQTFTVDNQFGVTLTKISLYFRAKDSGNIPVSIHIRPVSGGKPSQTTIVPDSHVYLNPSEVTAVGLNPQLSTIQEEPTDFVFDEPIYLQPNMSYAIVISSQSTEYELFSATTGENVYGSTSRRVTTQPAPGSLFLPQNGYQWLESKNQDIMFKLTRAKFDLGGASLILKNAHLPSSLLDPSPIRTTNGSPKIYVKQMCHGLQPGDTAQLDSCATVNGITANQLNTTFTVDSADLYGFTVTTAGTATADGFGGGEKVLSRQNVNFSTVNPIIDVLIPKNTSVDASAKFTTGRYISGSATRFVQDAQYKRISLNQNVDFDTPRTIYNRAEEIASLGSNPSSLVKIDLKTANDYVSPIINMQRASLILAGFCMDNPAITPHIYPVDDTKPYGGTTGFQHITTPVTLDTPAVGIGANLEVNMPEGSSVQMYYRTAASDENIYDKSWELMESISSVPSDNSQSYTKQQFLAGGPGGNLNAFNQVQTKTVYGGGDFGVNTRLSTLSFYSK